MIVNCADFRNRTFFPAIIPFSIHAIVLKIPNTQITISNKKY